MAYTALYRKFRPLTFAEIVGQEHITKTLRNQIIEGRVGHAYLFNGSRGTGKTSAAKVLARAINCLNPKQGEPCNECEICKAALTGSLTDIVEMDAASNNSVEDIRAIREEVNFLPTIAKYRVYIIDEVHMLSTGAFNALLKTLEEPPEHVKFILATTEPQKLPATILSRCQRFDFKRISEENIIKRLQIIQEEGTFSITPEAIKLVATLSEGALRDAWSILERCIQDGDIKIEADKIKELVGIPKLESIFKLVEGIAEKQVENCLEIIQGIIEEGKDITNLVWELIKYFRDILLYQTSKISALHSQEEKMQIEKLSQKISKEDLMEYICQFSLLENEMKWSTQKTVLLQATIIRLCNEKSKGIEELEKRVQQLEQKIKEGKTVPPTNPNLHITSSVAEQKEPKKRQNGLIEPKRQSTMQIGTIQEEAFWPQVLSQLKQEGKIMLYTNLMNAKAKKIDDMTVGIVFSNGLNSFGKTVLEKTENKEELRKKVSIACGKDMQIKYMDAKQQDIPKGEDNSELESLAKDLDLPINIIEE